ncbi:MAG TPA: hypothetical protein VFU15_10795 [Bacteroidia bacterium]|nr:hypothetical protein [Bacteroidia bacterium]
MSAIRNYFTVAPPDIGVKNYRFYVVNHIAGTVGGLTHFSWLVLFGITHTYPLFYFNFFSVALFVFFIWLNKRGHHLTALLMGISEVIAHQVLGVYVLGWDAGFQYILIIASMLLFLMPKGNTLVKYIFALLCVAGFLFIELVLRKSAPLYTIDKTVLLVLDISNITLSFFFLFIWAGFYNYAIFETEKALEERTEEVARAEKKAAVGTLTAKIAHEIQNPLNFVNNFSEISAELVNEIVHAGSEEERARLLAQLKDNLEKIGAHGKRADQIVKSMFLHLRERKGESPFGEKDADLKEEA